MSESAVVLVTGAARRVGAEIARILHAAGARVAVHQRTTSQAARGLVAELDAIRPDSAGLFQAELCDNDAVRRVVEMVVERFGRLDALVNNASSFFATPIGTTDAGAWDALIGSNLKGPFFLAQAAAPHLRASHGAIVNVTDIHAERPLRGYSVYCAAKAGLLGLTRALAVDLAPEVRVNAVAPGAIAWPEDETDFPESARVAIVENTLLKRVGAPTDIARTVKFLIFDAPYITGQVISVDGGRSIHL
jgi:pteridine reductase